MLFREQSGRHEFSKKYPNTKWLKAKGNKVYKMCCLAVPNETFTSDFLKKKELFQPLS